MVTDHVQTGNALAEDPAPPGFTRSARTPAWLHLKLWSWRKIDFSARRTIATAWGYGWTLRVLLLLLPRDARTAKRGVAIVSRPSVCLSVTLTCREHIGWTSSESVEQSSIACHFCFIPLHFFVLVLNPICFLFLILISDSLHFSLVQCLRTCAVTLSFRTLAATPRMHVLGTKVPQWPGPGARGRHL